MWINTKYKIESEEATKYFDLFKFFSEREDREGRAVVVERELDRRRVLFNGRDGIPDFHVGMVLSDLDDEAIGRGKVLVQIAFTDAGLIPELEDGELLDRLKNYLSVKIGVEEVVA